MNLEPKARFLKTAEAKAFADISSTPAFHRAVEVALSELQLAAPPKDDPAASWHRLQGAKRFAEILLNLCEVPERPVRGAPRENLTS